MRVHLCKTCKYYRPGYTHKWTMCINSFVPVCGKNPDNYKPVYNCKGYQKGI